MDAARKFNLMLQERRMRHADFHATFSTPEGQRVLKYLCQIGYIDKTTFNPLNRDKTLINEGARLLVLAILKHTHKQPEVAVTESILDTNT